MKLAHFKHLALGIVASFIAVPASANSVNEALSTCLFSVKGAGYVQALVSSKNGVETVRYKKTKKARTDKVSDSAFAEIEAGMTACVAEHTGN
ncbi:MAG: hypothetical protein AAFU86_06910 [Pseudomonadota bacterium]